jgi:replicative DNA helicase
LFNGKEEVFDLTVPATASWIANGIISHNSGAIEQDADIVSFIYRPEYYGILQDEEGQSLKGIAEFIVAKHRHGALDTIRIKFLDNFAKFTNLDDPSFQGFENPLSGPFTPSTGPFTPSTIIPSRMNDEDIPF